MAAPASRTWRAGDTAGVFRKDPADVLDFTVDFTDLLATGDAITGTPTVTPDSGLTATYTSTTTTAVTFAVSGGTAFIAYLVAVRIATTGGRTIERSICVQLYDL